MKAGVEGSSMHNQIFIPVQKSGNRIRQVPADLLHPSAIGMCGNARAGHSTRRQLHHERNVVGDQSTGGPNFDGREVNCRHPGPLGLQKCRPHHPSAAFRRWFQPVLLDNPCLRRTADPMTDY